MQIDYLSAIEEGKYVIAQANATLDNEGKLTDELVSARDNGESVLTSAPSASSTWTSSPAQIVSVAASLVPFLEHDDANRALMGANMQRQAVPVLRPEKAFVGTGIERVAAIDSGTVVTATRGGVVDYVDANRIVVRVNDDGDQCRRSRRRHLQPDQVPAFQPEHEHPPAPDRQARRQDRQGRRHRRRRLDRPRRARARPEHAGRVHALERLQLRGLDPHQRTRRRRRPLHLDPHRGAGGRWRATPSWAPRKSRATSRTWPRTQLARLDESGIVYVGAEVNPGDTLVGKVTPKGETTLTPEEKLLRAIFGEKASDVKDTSLRVDQGTQRHRHRRAGVHPRRHPARQARPADHRRRAEALSAST